MADEVIPERDDTYTGEHAAIAAWFSIERVVAGYLAVFVVAAIVTQAVSSIPASEEGSPIESFTSGLLWMLSFVSLLSALKSVGSKRQRGFWMALSAGLAVLAIDEAVGIHERTEPSGINDDFVKIAMWIAVPFVLWHVVRMARAAPQVRTAFIIGYFFHCLYILVEVGDGEFFQLAVSKGTLKSAEELFELLLLSFYMYGFAILYLRPGQVANSRLH